MAGNSKTTKRATPSKSKMHDTAEEMEIAAEVEAIGAGAKMAAGAKHASDAERARTVGRTVEAMGASDITRGYLI